MRAMRRPILCVAFLLALCRVSDAFQVSQRTNNTPRIERHQSGRAAVAFAPSITAPTTSTSLKAAPVIPPSVTKVALSCLIPTSLGYIKSEYGVSYGYGTSVAALAASILLQLAPGTVPYHHALALLFYGTRLDLFLLYRELCIPKFRKFRDAIEEKAPSNRLSRTPFILSCALLYACLAAPLFVTSTCSTFSNLTTGLVACTWIGFVVAALGDLQKSIVKSRKGDDALVTGGVFHFLRHPNFTGETFGWTASFLAAVSVGNWKQNTGLVAASALGWAGIVFVLAMASTNLEKKQKEKYGDSKEYEAWVKGSWAGFTLKKDE